MQQQQGDVLLYQSVDGGEIDVNGGVVSMSPGLETAVYLSLFGGRDWWGNISEDSPARRYESQTGELLDTIPPTSANLLRLQDTVKTDLEWMLSEGVATEITVTASIPGVNQVKIAIDIDGDETLVFVENWKGSL